MTTTHPRKITKAAIGPELAAQLEKTAFLPYIGAAAALYGAATGGYSVGRDLADAVISYRTGGRDGTKQLLRGLGDAGLTAAGIATAGAPTLGAAVGKPLLAGAQRVPAAYRAGGLANVLRSGGRAPQAFPKRLGASGWRALGLRGAKAVGSGIRYLQK